MVTFLFRPIDAASLFVFRIGGGLFMAFELLNQILIGKMHQLIEPKFHFSYLFFDWLRPWPREGILLHYVVTIFAAVAVAFNYNYRFFSVVLFLGYTCLFLFEQAFYVNHMYLYCLLAFWMMVLPLDNCRKTKPAWMLYIVLFHMALAYFFGGIAKLNEDWLHGSPMNSYLAQRTHLLLGPLYAKSWAPYLFSYGGIFFDLLIVPMMLFRMTRVAGFIIAIIFHLSNVMMFGLATFPWFSLLLTSLFFSPSWPRQVPILRKILPWNVEVAPVYYLNWKYFSLISLYVILHLCIPLRQYLYEGDPSWTEEGHMFSWRMMLREKKGRVHFLIQSREMGIENVRLRDHLTEKQIRSMKGNPDLILQFAHYLRDEYQMRWKTEISISASSFVSLNGRPYQELIRPETNLAKETRGLKMYSWIQKIDTQRSLVNSSR